MGIADRNGSAEEEKRWIETYLQTGDTAPLGKLYEKYRERIYLLCLKILRNPEDARDLTSETFVRAFDQMGRFTPGAAFFPWLHRIATNLCIDAVRRRSRFRHQALQEKDRSAEPDEIENREQRLRQRGKILQALQQMKPPQRRCFCLFYIHDLTYREIAELTGYSLEQVRSHIQNGRRKFKLFMEKT